MCQLIKKIVVLSVMSIVFMLSTFAIAKSDNKQSKSDVTYKIRYPAQVNILLKQINPQDMWNNLTIFTQFPDRSALSKSGVDAVFWLKNQVEALATKAGRDDVAIFLVETKGVGMGAYTI